MGTADGCQPPGDGWQVTGRDTDTGWHCVPGDAQPRTVTAPHPGGWGSLCGGDTAAGAGEMLRGVLLGGFRGVFPPPEPVDARGFAAGNTNGVVSLGVRWGQTPPLIPKVNNK